MMDTCGKCASSLTLGRLHENNIICPKDGFAYTPTGQCTTGNFHVLAYPAQDKYGWLWAFLGDLPEEQRIPIPELPYLHDKETYKHIYGKFDWKVFYARALENGVDAAHTPFVHGGSFGNPDDPSIEDYILDEFPNSARATIHLTPQKSKGLWGKIYKRERTTVRTVVQWWMPNVSLLEVHLPMGDLIIFNAHIPHDSLETSSHYIALSTFFKGNWADKDAHRRVINIFSQDKKVVEAQRPEILPYDIGAELSVRSDLIQIAFRKMRQKYQDMGWARHEGELLPSPFKK
jgi:phenylpropionate dioxygenase-like ring-hydroxylating dioxygenase large terminal subunit